MATETPMTPYAEQGLVRSIVDHHDGHGLAESLDVRADALDPNAGNASHHYVVRSRAGDVVADIQFQRGPRNLSDSTDGIVENVLLAILIDRMACFNAGPMGTRENALVRTKCEEALHWLKARADDRARRGVLGSQAK